MMTIEEDAMTEEEWRPVPYEPFGATYEVSSWGRVRSVTRVDSYGRRRQGRLLKNILNGAGYHVVALSNAGTTKHYPVGRLVLYAFVGPPKPGQVCRYLGARDEASLDRVKWDYKLGEEKRRNTRVPDYVKDFLVNHRDEFPIARLAAFAGVGQGTVRKIIRDADQAEGPEGHEAPDQEAAGRDAAA